MGDVSKNFSFNEFTCPCCGKHDISLDLVDRLQQVRDMYGKGMKITSGYRCKKHNDSLPKSSPSSSHIDGEAVDIYCADSSRRDELVGFLRTKFNRMGLHKHFIHVDISKTKASPVLWVY